MPHRLIISLGSNADAERNVSKAQEVLTQALRTECMLFSRTLWTEDENGGPLFLNCLCTATTERSLNATLQLLKDLERQCGRRESDRKAGIVSIDIDLLAYDNQQLKADDWCRAYVATLLAELAQEAPIAEKHNKQ